MSELEALRAYFDAHMEMHAAIDSDKFGRAYVKANQARDRLLQSLDADASDVEEVDPSSLEQRLMEWADSLPAGTLGQIHMGTLMGVAREVSTARGCRPEEDGDDAGATPDALTLPAAGNPDEDLWRVLVERAEQTVLRDFGESDFDLIQRAMRPRRGT
jgi:hypothetical protein